MKKFVGRTVRLNKDLFEKVEKGHGKPVDNYFVVAAVSQGMRKLVCYGSNLRIEVSASEVVFV